MNELAEEGVPDPPEVLEIGDRITQVWTLTHEHLGDTPLTLTSTASQFLSETEQPYQRRLKSSLEPVEVDYGWIEEPGLVVIENLLSREIFTTVHPEENEDGALVIHHEKELLSYVFPGWPLMLHYPNGTLYISSIKEGIPYKVTVLSK